MKWGRIGSKTGKCEVKDGRIEHLISWKKRLIAVRNKRKRRNVQFQGIQEVSFCMAAEEKLRTVSSLLTVEITEASLRNIQHLSQQRKPTELYSLYLRQAVNDSVRCFRE